MMMMMMMTMMIMFWLWTDLPSLYRSTDVAKNSVYLLDIKIRLKIKITIFMNCDLGFKMKLLFSAPQPTRPYHDLL